MTFNFTNSRRNKGLISTNFVDSFFEIQFTIFLQNYTKLHFTVKVVNLLFQWILKLPFSKTIKNSLCSMQKSYTFQRQYIFETARFQICLPTFQEYFYFTLKRWQISTTALEPRRQLSLKCKYILYKNCV